LQRAPAHDLEQPMHLVDREHGGGGIVDRGRQGLERDVDEDAEREHRVLLERPLAAERDRRLQHAIVEGGGTPCSANSGSS
jgi:hypothetical protein